MNPADMFDKENAEKIGDRYKRSIDTLAPANQLLNGSGKLLPIKYDIVDHIKVTDGTYASGDFHCVNYLAEDSFYLLTRDLTKHLAVLKNVLPHISKDSSKTDDTKSDLLQKTVKAQQSVLTSVMAASDGPTKEEYKELAQNLTTEEALPGKVEVSNDDVFGWDILKGPELDAKKLIRRLYDQTKTDGTFEKYKADFDEDKLSSAGATKFVKQVLDEEEIKGEERQEDKLVSYLTDARLLGSYQHDIYKRGNIITRQLFITKDNILTDGFKIFPIKINQNPVADTPYIKEDNGIIKISMPPSYYGNIIAVGVSNTEISGALNWVKNHYDSTASAMKDNGTYNAGGGMNSVLFGGKTSSQRPTKKRSTRRIRK
jgi:hypothetical protein